MLLGLGYGHCKHIPWLRSLFIKIKPSTLYMKGRPKPCSRAGLPGGQRYFIQTRSLCTAFGGNVKIEKSGQNDLTRDSQKWKRLTFHKWGRLAFPLKNLTVLDKTVLHRHTYFHTACLSCHSMQNLNDSDNLQEKKADTVIQGRRSKSSVKYEEYMSIENVVDFLKENLCMDLCVIKVPEGRTRVKYVEYFIVVSGRSPRHLKAMAFGLVSKHKKVAREKGGISDAIISGEECLEWMALDLGSIVIHFMLPEAREMYELEKLWTLGREYDEQYQRMLEVDRLFDMPVDIEEIEKSLQEQDIDIDVTANMEESKQSALEQDTDIPLTESTER